ncbi:hypothetical protein OG401_21170 [Kitasatospora purpeofusca]|uniref:hypothetical protein n=1 Tax=Kitasatospora purpeofusca TaxID=67352 RepID=UPI0022546B6F|nr:hypothetical protein [Kitasatospora purpeofusca]MCX4686793.1 hypothetical protein [Kitasatospora purpeofusca]
MRTRVTRELALLDDGLPLLFMVIADELVIVGDPRFFSDDQLSDACEKIQQWIENSELTAAGAFELLAPVGQQLLTCGSVDLPR